MYKYDEKTPERDMNGCKMVNHLKQNQLQMTDDIILQQLPSYKYGVFLFLLVWVYFG
uniref:Uncharacterized protein n=1 Tax=viral metagenome TaxID=1070528 RepID=A0A6C0CM67_9ZZZZ